MGRPFKKDPLLLEKDYIKKYNLIMKKERKTLKEKRDNVAKIQYLEKLIKQYNMCIEYEPELKPRMKYRAKKEWCLNMIIVLQNE